MDWNELRTALLAAYVAVKCSEIWRLYLVGSFLWFSCWVSCFDGVSYLLWILEACYCLVCTGSLVLEFGLFPWVTYVSYSNIYLLIIMYEKCSLYLLIGKCSYVLILIVTVMDQLPVLLYLLIVYIIVKICDKSSRGPCSSQYVSWRKIYLWNFYYYCEYLRISNFRSWVK